MTTLSELKLSPTQVSALVVLMAEARPLGNGELKAIAGFGLTGGQRTDLVGAGLITSVKEGRQFVHELSESGWQRIGELLQIDAIGGIGPTRGALRVLLAALDRGLQRGQMSAGSFFYSDPDSTSTAPPRPPVVRVNLDQAIRLAYKELAKSPGDWVRLSKIRAALAGAGRSDVDAALERLAVQPDVRIIPIANLKSLTTQDKEAAIRLGGEMKHAIAIEG